MPAKRKRTASPAKKTSIKKKKTATTPNQSTPTDTSLSTTNNNDDTNIRANGELQMLVSESILNANTTPEMLLARIPGIIRVTSFEDWTVCLNHPYLESSVEREKDLGPYCRKVRIRRSRYGAEKNTKKSKNEKSTTSTTTSSSIPYNWEVLEVTRKFEHKSEKQRQRPSRIRQESITSCQCSDNAQSFFESIGHTKNREFTRIGTSATIKNFTNGLVELKIFQMYENEQDVTNQGNESSLYLIELSAKIQDFNDDGGTNRSEICKNTVRYILDKQISDLIRSVCVAPGKEKYDDYRKFVKR